MQHSGSEPHSKQGKSKPSLSLKTVAEQVINYFGTKTSTIFDINDVAVTLGVPKRRLYDVLNIMTPLGLVGRNGRGKYVWNSTMQPTFTTQHSQEKLHVRDLSSKFLAYVRDSDQSAISISSICESVFEDKNGQLRRLYDILAVFEVLKLIKRQAKSGDFLVMPLLRNMFITKMLPPKKRSCLLPVMCTPTLTSDEPKQNAVLISPPPSLGPGSSTQAWLMATSFR